MLKIYPPTMFGVKEMLDDLDKSTPDIIDKVEEDEHFRINQEYNEEKTKEDQEDEIEIRRQTIEDQEQKWGRA